MSAPFLPTLMLGVGVFLAGADVSLAQEGVPIVACSADGSRIVAVWYPGGISISTNLGATWNPTAAPSADWFSVACSADGTKIIAGIYGGGIYTSPDGGASWTSNSLPLQLWSGLASSWDGSKLAAVGGPSSVYTSRDSGVTWTSNNLPNLWWGAVASSADGQRLAAVGGAYNGVAGGVYTTTNAGDSWTPNNVSSNVPSDFLLSVACSADGATLVAAVDGGGIYISTNCGAVWTQTSAPAEAWKHVACSADGTKLAAGGPVWFAGSRDSGASWDGGFDDDCNSIAMSADGNELIVGNAFVPTVSVSRLQGSPFLNITTAAEKALVSWIVPSSPFALQQTSDLSSSKWTDVPMEPTLTNYLYQVIVPPSAGNAFFRLVSR